MMNNKLYDVLKWISLVALPALGALYFALAGIWGLPYGEEITGTIVCVETFLGALLGISTVKYHHKNTDVVEVEEDPGEEGDK